MKLSTITEWLAWIEQQTAHAPIQLGLERVIHVATALQLLPVKPRVITVAGTNGKGTTSATLESIYRQAGMKVGLFTSPILFKHNEQVRINGKFAQDEYFCDAFNQVAAHCGDIVLTPFEYHTLAGLIIFSQYTLDLLILEVGLGGRLDAVNVVDADLAIITSIGIDHTQYLGTTRDAIAFEKAGILRKGRPVICGDPNPPASLLQQVEALSTPFFGFNRDFFVKEDRSVWSWKSTHHFFENLPYNGFYLPNLATAIMATTVLQSQLPVPESAIHTGLKRIDLPARQEWVQHIWREMQDVAHNPEACALLAHTLRLTKKTGKTFAVFSMLADKDIAGSVKALKSSIDEWYVAPLSVVRAAPLTQLQQAFAEAGIAQVHYFAEVKEAYEAVCQIVTKEDLVVIFGSFHTVSQCRVRKSERS
ncbi:MAG: bifunctional tetrahydrofolate synthase/dihydrofolate synthase [Gammaproteobacteria bacterium]|nr:bifunctional tetrahydrofolate synthase/dihydrofolate synthase [Gammaproteobacteria bacterium]